MHRRARVVLGSLAFEDDAVTTRLLDRYVAEGGRALDLANVYRGGDAELAVGRWLRARRTRDDVVLYVKGCHPPSCSPRLVAREVQTARRLLGVDSLDVFLLHRDDPEVPVAEFAEALLAQMEAGMIRAFGVSNWTLPRFRALAECVGAAGKLVAFSNHFSLAEMVEPPWPGCLATTKDEVRALADSGVRVLAWSSLAGGYFAGGDPPSWRSEENGRRRDRVTELARELGATPTAVALAYVLHQPASLLPVVGTRSEAHLVDLLAAAEIDLSREQLGRLESGR